MSKRILVVEDQADNRQIIRDMLAPTDYQIAEAENGEQALAAVSENSLIKIVAETDGTAAGGSFTSNRKAITG